MNRLMNVCGFCTSDSNVAAIMIVRVCVFVCVRVLVYAHSLAHAIHITIGVMRELFTNYSMLESVLRYLIGDSGLDTDSGFLNRLAFSHVFLQLSSDLHRKWGRGYCY